MNSGLFMYEYVDDASVAMFCGCGLRCDCNMTARGRTRAYSNAAISLCTLNALRQNRKVVDRALFALGVVVGSKRIAQAPGGRINAENSRTSASTQACRSNIW